jgi:hypothetical protein
MAQLDARTVIRAVLADLDGRIVGALEPSAT